MTNTTTCREHTRIINGRPVVVEAYTRTVGHGFTKDGHRMTRAQAEFLMTLKARARKGNEAAIKRLTKMGETF